MVGLLGCVSVVVTPCSPDDGESNALSILIPRDIISVGLLGCVSAADVINLDSLLQLELRSKTALNSIRDQRLVLLIIW